MPTVCSPQCSNCHCYPCLPNPPDAHPSCMPTMVPTAQAVLAGLLVSLLFCLEGAAASYTISTYAATGFAKPVGCGLDANGNLYVTDITSDVVFKVSSAGALTVFAGISNTPGYTGNTAAATLAKFGNPAGVVFDSTGNA